MADAERQLAAGEPTAVVPFQALTLPWPLLSRQSREAIATPSPGIMRQRTAHWPRPPSPMPSASAICPATFTIIPSRICFRAYSASMIASTSKSSRFHSAARQ